MGITKIANIGQGSCENKDGHWGGGIVSYVIWSSKYLQPLLRLVDDIVLTAGHSEFLA